MNVFPFLIAVFLLRSIQNTVKVNPHLQSWDKKINTLMLAAVVLMIAQTVFDREHVTRWLWNVLLLALYIWYIKLKNCTPSKLLA